ncbi:MAG: nitrilase-related carbon-nitrogen hydrolase [Planctomycetota bacterium]
MRAHIVQPDIIWEDREANFRKVEALLESTDVARGDLVLLPEMFDSGFSLHADDTADEDGRTRAFLERLAEDYDATVQAGRTMHACPGGRCDKARNNALAIAPDDRGDARVLADYDKIHPFSFGREHEVFAGGRDVAVYRWASDADALVVCPAICYDLRFPELFRRGLQRGAELFAVIANWPAARQHHWRTLLLARAIENQAFVLASNRTGRDPHLEYAGGSIAVDPRGEVLGELGDEEAVLTVGVDPEALRQWRSAFPAWRDARLPGAPAATPSGDSPARSTHRSG